MSLTFNEALIESSRCLFCYDAPCIKACPTGINIPAFIRKITTGNLKGAARVIYEANVFSLTCARVCPVEVLCENSCVLKQYNKRPVQIGKLQGFVSEWALQRDITFFKRESQKNKKIAIIGAGPAGLSCAYELARMGYEVVVFEKKPLAGGLPIYSIPPYKLATEDARKEIKMLLNTGIKLQTNVEVGKDIPLKQLEKEFDAIFIATGLTESPNLNIPGEDLKGVFDAIDFLEKLKTERRRTKVGERVAVIGGGNTAIDAAIVAKQSGAEWVTIIYRRSKNEMPCYPHEYELALKNDIIFMWQSAPVKIYGDTRVKGLKCIHMRLGRPDASGRPRPEPVPGAEFPLHVDTVIKSIGQNVDMALLNQIPDLKLAKGYVAVNPDTMQTSNPKYFAGGDCIGGQMAVVWAVEHGKRAAKGISKYLSR